jgi:hypothetical protein
MWDLNISQPNRPPRPVKGIALLFLLLWMGLDELIPFSLCLVGIATGYGLDDLRVRIRVPVG